MYSSNSKSTKLFSDSVLQEFIRSFWYYRNLTDLQENFSILPNGCFVQLFNCIESNIEVSYLTGLWSRSINVTVPPRTDLFAIQFKPLAAEYILKRSIADNLNTAVEMTIDDYPLLGLLASEFQSFEGYVDDSKNKISDYVTKIELDPRKRKLLKILFEKEGDVRLDDVSKLVNWSPRQIRRYFKSQYGLTFKEYVNILKLNSSYKYLKKSRLQPENNYYYDQSHFIKEVKKYTGLSPRKLLRNKTSDFYNYILEN